MINENKTGKYLKYAIGEIILVVIGILIALQINNWNESRKEQAILKSSLISLKSNLEEDIRNIKAHILFTDDVLADVDFAFKVITLPEYEDRPYATYIDSIGGVLTEKTFTPIKIAFQSMESRAHFQWLKDQQLAESIYRYYAGIDKIQYALKSNNEYVQYKLEPFLYNQTDFSAGFTGVNPYSDKSMFKINNTKVFKESKVFVNGLIGRKFRTNGEKRAFKDALKSAQDLINEIEIYLKNN